MCDLSSLFGGPSDQQSQISKEQQSLFGTLQQDMQTQFADQESILGGLRASFAPIIDAGINQFGFSPQETAALRTQASAGTAAQYQMGRTATGNAIAAIGGGNEFLPSGTATQLNQQNALAAAQQESTQQLGITEAGYAQGRQNFLAATNELGGLETAMTPWRYGSSAVDAGAQAFGSASTIQQENSQMFGSIGSILGGAIAGMAG